jgi:pilus assembly protein Flp/PilA
MTRFERFLNDESGATLIEYALIASAMGVALIGAMPLIGRAVTSSFSSIASHIASGK